MTNTDKQSRPLTRLGALIAKESLQVVRDPSSLAIAFVLPAILLFLFGYGVSLDPQNIRLGLVIEEPSPEAQSLTAAFLASPYFDVVVARDRATFSEALVDGRLKALVVLDAHFNSQVRQGAAAPIQLIVDGGDPNTANLAEGYVAGVWQSWSAEQRRIKGIEGTTAVSVEPRFWFNPDLRSRNVLVPGLVAIIMTLIGTLLTALVIAREWERGTMEALMSTPASIVEILLGKLVPYYLLGMASMAVSVLMAVLLFEVPLRGSPLVLTGVATVFLISALALGLLISSVARDQFIASQISLLAAFLPAFLLSGFIFEIGSMPTIIQVITHIVPARYFVACLQTLFLAGNIWSVILPNTAAMGAIALVLLVVTGARTRKRLD